jgi:hypothetical protein
MIRSDSPAASENSRFDRVPGCGAQASGTGVGASPHRPGAHDRATRARLDKTTPARSSRLRTVMIGRLHASCPASRWVTNQTSVHARHALAGSRLTHAGRRGAPTGMGRIAADKWPIATADKWPAAADKWPVTAADKWPVTAADKWPVTAADKWPAAADKWPVTTADKWPVAMADKWPAATADKWPATAADKWPAAADKWPVTTADKWPVAMADKWPGHADMRAVGAQTLS